MHHEIEKDIAEAANGLANASAHAGALYPTEADFWVRIPVVSLVKRIEEFALAYPEASAVIDHLKRELLEGEK